MSGEQLADLVDHLITLADADEIRSNRHLVTGGLDHLNHVSSIGRYGACKSQNLSQVAFSP